MSSPTGRRSSFGRAHSGRLRANCDSRFRAGAPVRSAPMPASRRPGRCAPSGPRSPDTAGVLCHRLRPQADLKRSSAKAAHATILCANCDTRFHGGDAACPFCSSACELQAKTVRAFRSAFCVLRSRPTTEACCRPMSSMTFGFKWPMPWPTSTVPARGTCLRRPASSSSNATTADADCVTPPVARSNRLRATDPIHVTFGCCATPAGPDHPRLPAIAVTHEQNRQIGALFDRLTAQHRCRRPDPRLRHEERRVVALQPCNA